MAKYKCKMCGAPLDVSEGQTVITCDFCQSKQTVANANDERKENLFNRANSLRAACDFDKAILAYQSILSIFPSEPEAHWGLCLCKYGIEYVDDPSTHKKIPTIHRMSFDSILKDSDYLAALSYADAIAREEYQEEASQIANIQKNILSISQKEEPFDVFICYKETTETGKRTPDSVLAQEVYSNLTDRGYKVFFSRITLESKLGSMYEPYIFAALNSAKIMLVFGTKKEYFEAVWVKNEWSRFIDMMKTRPDHYLIPCYRDMDAYEMPEQFLSFQGQDMGKLGFMQDLIRGIDKIMGRSEAPKAQAETKIIQTDVNVPALLTRAEILIGDGNFEKADELLERVLDNDPKNSQAYLLKLLIELQLKTVDELKTLDDTIEGNSNFKKAYDFGDSQQKNKLSSINEFIVNRNEEARLGRLYDIAMDYKNSGRYAEAEAAFSEIAGFRDANKQALDCVNLGKEDIYKKATLLKESKQYNEAIEIFDKIKDYKDSEFQISQCHELSDKDKYERAIELKARGMFDEASSLFMEILRYSDSDFQVDECARLKAEAKKEAVYVTCLFNREINPYFDSSALKKACEKLATIPGYKDSDKLLTQYEGILKDYEAELAKKREVAAREKAKKMKKVKKISFFSAIGALGLTGVLLLTFLFLVPSGRQGNIQSLIDQGKYDEAMALIDQNGNFGDTENLKNMCYAGQAFERLDYETGIDYIYKIGGAVDVAYDSNGGNASKNTETIKRARGYIDNDPDKSGYDFHGWVLTGYDLDAKSHYASIDLKAQYEIITYTITYSLDGGTCSNLPTEYTTEESVYIPNPTKEGYTFIGWTGLDLSSATIDYSIPVGSTGNKVYTANWRANDYRIYLNANGGAVDKEYIDVTFDSSYSLPTPSYVGYDFNGWYDEFSKQYSSGIYKTASDVYLNASWNAHSYSITYNLYGGTNDSHNPSFYTIENSDIVLNDPSREGYTFTGWTTSSINEPTKNIKINSGSTGDLVFNANWSANTYNVTLNLNGGESEKTSYSFVYDSSYEITAPTRTGYAFNRFEDEDGNAIPLSGKWTIAKDLDIFAYWDANPDTKYVINHYTEDLNGGGYTKVSTENLFGFSDKTVTVNSKHYEGFTPVDANKQITIAADGSTIVDFYYTRNSYTITFISNGGTSIDSETYKYEQQIPSTLKPARSGYTFAGWYSNEKQTTLFDKMPASNQTVYAYYSEETKASYFDYSFNGQQAKITKGNGLTGKVVVPEYIGGKAVISIGDNAFLNCTAITEIKLSDQVEELGASAFKGCSSLVRIDGTSNLEVIKDSTFEGCRNLVYFPDLSNVVSIGNNAFKDCSSLTSITISESLTSIGNYAFQNCVMLIQTPDLTNVTYIGNYAFQGCKLLTEIKSLDGCATFGEGIFTLCENIAKITLSFRENIEQLYVSSFFGRTSTFDGSKYYQVTGKNNSVCYVPKNLTEIEFDTTGKTPDYFLYNLSSITKVSDKSSSSEAIGKHAFDGCAALVNYTVQNNDVSLVDEYAFRGCSSLSSVSGFDLEEVKKYAFADCSSLLITPILENATYVGDYAFSGCSLITTLKIPNASYMGLSSLYGCSALTELEVPFVGTTINSTEAFGVIFGIRSFENTYEVKENGVTYFVPISLSKLHIETGNVTGMQNLKSITDISFGNSIGTFDIDAFSGCCNIQNLSSPVISTNEMPQISYEGSWSLTDGGYKATPNTNCAQTTSYLMFDINFSGSISFDYYIKQNYASDKLIVYLNDDLKMSTPTNSYSTRSGNYSLSVQPGDVVRIGHYYYANRNDETAYIGKITNIAFDSDGVYGPSSRLSTLFKDSVNSLKNIEVTDGAYIPQAYFKDLSNLINVTMTDSIETIFESAFENCINLKKISESMNGCLPESLSKICNNAFKNCASLTSARISSNCKYIGDYAFAECKNITSLIINDSLEYIGSYCFANCSNLAKINSEKTNSLNIPYSVLSIGDYAFLNCGLVEDIVLQNDDMTYLGFAVFSGCNSLTKLTMPIVFDGDCVNPSFGCYFGSQSKQDNNVYVPSCLKDVCITNLPDNNDSLFYECRDIVKISIPSCITEISDYCFYNCISLTSLNSNENKLVVPQNVSFIGAHSFENCISATCLELDDSLIEVGEYAFEGMVSILTLIIPENVKEIGRGALKDMSSLTDITVPFIGKSRDANYYEAVFGYIFDYETQLQNSTGSYSAVSNSKKEPKYEFYATKYKSVDNAIWQYTCDNAYQIVDRGSGYSGSYNIGGYGGNSYFYFIPRTIRNIHITDNTHIKDGAFFNMDFVESIFFSENTLDIGKNAFCNCSSLEHLNSTTDGMFTLGASVKIIDDYAFYNCSQLSEINTGDLINKIGNYAFAENYIFERFNSDSHSDFNLPYYCETIGSYAFKGCALVKSVAVPDSTISIGLGAFNGFNSLEKISIPFVGESQEATYEKAVFGYIFGYTNKLQYYVGDTSSTYTSDSYKFNKDFVNVQYGEDEVGVWMYTCKDVFQVCGRGSGYSGSYNIGGYAGDSYYFYVPTTLRSITVTLDPTIPVAAFNNLSFVESIHLINCIESIGDYAFQNCNATITYDIAPSQSIPWNGQSYSLSYHSGNGTISEPYEIFTPQEYLLFIKSINDGLDYENTYFAISSDLDFGGHQIPPMANGQGISFKGNLDGRGHRIFNFSLSQADEGIGNGMFSCVEGTIKNVGFENVEMSFSTSSTDDRYYGLLVGRLEGVLENVYITGNISVSSVRNNYTAGLVGYNNGKIACCYSNVEVISSSSSFKCWSAGLVAYNNGEISSSFAFGNVSSNGYAEAFSYASGLVAFEGTNSSVTNCYRYNGQIITKLGNTSVSYNNVGNSADLAEIISYCKSNWDGSVWTFKQALPSF